MDRKGNTLAVGDCVYVLPERQTRTGGAGWVRRINGDRARVDDGPPAQSALLGEDNWTWSAWVKAGEVEKIWPGAAPAAKA